MSGSAARGVQRIAVPFSDLASGERAVAALLREARGQEGDIEVELVALVDPLRSGKVGIFVSEQRARREARAAGTAWIETLAAQLAGRGIPCRASVVLGPIAAGLRTLGARADLARIVVAALPGGAWRHWPRRFALHAAVRPVTVVS